MGKKKETYYSLIRTLHIYTGLFISPFVLIFGISVLAYNHAGILNRISEVKSLPEIRTKLDHIPNDTTNLLIAKAIIQQLGINGEIDYINMNEDKISFPLNKPGLKSRVEVNTHTDSVLITSQMEGSIRAMNYLHIMPGQHNANIRGNSIFLKVWKVLADLVVGLLVFLVLSGIILWYIIKFERSEGIYAIILGLLSFIGLLYIII